MVRARKSSAVPTELAVELVELEDFEETLAALELVAEEVLVPPQLAARLLVVLTIVLAMLSTTILVQPLAVTSDAGKESPQAPFGSILKRGPPAASPTVKLRQIS